MSYPNSGGSNGPRRKPNNKRKGHGRPGGGRGNQKGPRQSSITDVNLLIKKAIPKEEVIYVSDREIKDLPVRKSLRDRLIKKGFKRPTEIQDKTLEALLDGRDLLGIAQTGTGKTGAFLIPIIEEFITGPKGQHALVVVPTRELAIQVQEEFRSMTKDLGLYSACFIGGTSINRDMQALRRTGHLIVGTPGRLLDLTERNALDLRKFQTLVLDEFDRMLDMGFAKDVQRIISGMRNRQHTMLFSATLDKKQQKQIDDILYDPVIVKVSSGETSADQVDQNIVRLDPGEDKFARLMEILDDENCERVILFDETKHRVNRLCQKLNKSGVSAEQIQGNKSQNARQKALNAFKAGRAKVLVATDVAARGIDVSDVTHVINYQIPLSYDSYIHRIGRTGRAGKTGIALTFVD